MSFSIPVGCADKKTDRHQDDKQTPRRQADTKTIPLFRNKQQPGGGKGGGLMGGMCGLWLASFVHVLASFLLVCTLACVPSSSPASLFLCGLCLASRACLTSILSMPHELASKGPAWQRHAARFWAASRRLAGMPFAFLVPRARSKREREKRARGGTKAC